MILLYETSARFCQGTLFKVAKCTGVKIYVQSHLIDHWTPCRGQIGSIHIHEMNIDYCLKLLCVLLYIHRIHIMLFYYVYPGRKNEHISCNFCTLDVTTGSAVTVVRKWGRERRIAGPQMVHPVTTHGQTSNDALYRTIVNHWVFFYFFELFLSILHTYL